MSFNLLHTSSDRLKAKRDIILYKEHEEGPKITNFEMKYNIEQGYTQFKTICKPIGIPCIARYTK